MSELSIFSNASWLNKKTDKEELNNLSPKQVQILKYMGNKRGLLDWLIPLLNDQLKYGNTFLDLFAGTSSVGYALKPKVKIIANDIQEYSSVISTALLKYNSSLSENSFEEDLEKHYKKNLKSLMVIFGKAAKEERRILEIKDISAYDTFCKTIPKYGELVSNDFYKLNSYVKERYITNKRNTKKKSPYILFSTYFPNTFFGLKQCLEIDSLRFAIDQIKNTNKQAVYLSCLLYAVSKAVNSSGHFAEYLNPHSEHSTSLILKQRDVSVVKHFTNKLSEFSDIYLQNNWKNEVYNFGYQDLIEKLYKEGKLKKIDLIYIDPPYTNAQYSRFYHIPETLVKYDYPILTVNKQSSAPVKGRYRDDRHKSKFSHTAQVEKVFREMFDFISSRTDSALAVSYSDNSILKPVEKLIAIAEEFYEIIDTKNGYSHNAQGSKFKDSGKGKQVVHEYLLICKHKKR